MQASERIRRIMDAPAYQEALAELSRDHDRIVSETIRLTEVPAPPFKEEAKAKVYLEMLRESGLANIEVDAEGNVMGVRKGTGGAPLVAVASHLDTVFPEGTDVTVKREGSKLYAPGVSDNTHGLAIILGLIRAMDRATIETASDILFVASAGEEGLGDLRGMKHLFRKGSYKDRIKTFIALDGSDPSRIVTAAVGSRRYRVTFRGPGGHSYGAFGTVNPMYAMGAFLAGFGAMKVPEQTSYSVGVASGGTSVNAIPVSASLEIDLRSIAPAELDKMEQRMREIAAAAAEGENKARSTKRGPIAVEIGIIGDRPAGSTYNPLLGIPQAETANAALAPDKNTQLVSYACAAIAASGLKPSLEASSTDANIAMSLRIPAITIASGTGGRTHSLEEWLDVDKAVSLRQFGIAMTTILAAAGMRL